jgi:hypothetical protein
MVLVIRKNLNITRKKPERDIQAVGFLSSKQHKQGVFCAIYTKTDSLIYFLPCIFDRNQLTFMRLLESLYLFRWGVQRGEAALHSQSLTRRDGSWLIAMSRILVPPLNGYESSGAVVVLANTHAHEAHAWFLSCIMWS